MPALFRPPPPRLLAAVPCLLFALLLPVSADTSPSGHPGQRAWRGAAPHPDLPGGLDRFGYPRSVAPAMAAAEEPPPPEPHSTVDVAIFYTSELRKEIERTEPIKGRIDRLIADSNQIFQNSKVHLTLRLVAAHEVHYREEDSDVDLTRFHKKDDGYMDRVHTIREQTQADVMVLLRADNVGGGYINYYLFHRDYIFYAAHYAFAVSPMHELTFTHEVGHVMGLAHDRYTEDCQDADCDGILPQFPYGYGYVNLRGLEPGAPAVRTLENRYGLCRPLPGLGTFFVQALPSLLEPPLVVTTASPLGIPSTSTAVGRDGPADAVQALNNVRAVAGGLSHRPSSHHAHGRPGQSRPKTPPKAALAWCPAGPVMPPK